VTTIFETAAETYEVVLDSGSPSVICAVGPGMPMYILRDATLGLGCIGQWFETLRLFYRGETVAR
jgi:hypothetical protein